MRALGGGRGRYTCWKLRQSVSKAHRNSRDGAYALCLCTAFGQVRVHALRLMALLVSEFRGWRRGEDQ